jgi:16S rRNA (guanine527-N7)-methyltransferase
MGHTGSPPNLPDALTELARAAHTVNVPLSAAAIGGFQRYVEILLFWRKRLSLTAAASPLAIVQRHVADSLSVIRFIRAGDRIADLGSGAGFPGVPVAIVCPYASVFLIEAKRRKASFLREVARAVALHNVRVIEARAEQLPNELLATFDIVVSRAVWRVTQFLDISKGLLKDQGLAISMKGPKGRSESIDSIGGFSPVETVEYLLADGTRRFLLVYRKDESFT